MILEKIIVRLMDAARSRCDVVMSMKMVYPSYVSLTMRAGILEYSRGLIFSQTMIASLRRALRPVINIYRIICTME